jgi:hypothetical protein
MRCQKYSLNNHLFLILFILSISIPIQLPEVDARQDFAKPVHFMNFSVRDGLSNNRVCAVKQDKAGTLPRETISPEALAEQIAALPAEWRKEMLKMAKGGYTNKLSQLLDEIHPDFSGVASVFKRHITDYRFDLLVELLQGPEMEKPDNEH